MADLTSYYPTLYSSNTDSFGTLLKGNNDMSKLMVTSPESDNKGKVFIYNYSSGNFTFYSLISAAPYINRSAGDGFGTSLALSAIGGVDTYFVGCPGKSLVYVYENPTTPTTSQTYLLTASDYTTNTNIKDFGSALALSGRNITVGCARNSDSVANGGACYFFILTGGVQKFKQFQKLTASNAAAGDRFGFSTAVYENKLAVGAPTKTVGGALSAGAVYVYTYSPTTSSWDTATEQIIYPPVYTSEGFFGYKLDIDRNGLLITSPNADANGVYQAGAAYYYTRAGSTYTLANTFTGYLENFTALSGVRQQSYAFGAALSSAGGNTSVVAGAPSMVCFDYPDGLAAFKYGGISVNNVGASAPKALCTFRNTLSTTAIDLGNSISTAFPGIVVAGAPTPVAAIPGAFFKLGSPYVGDNYVKSVMGTPASTTEITGTGMTTISLASYITNNIPATAYSATGLPTGASLNASTGDITGTITASPAVYTVTPFATNIGGTTTGGSFTITVVAAAGTNYTLGTAGSGPVSIGSLGGSFNSINLLLAIATSTSDSSLSAREDNTSNPYRTALGSDSTPKGNTGVCNPYQTEKNASNWAPTGTNNTYLPARMSEFRGAYRWYQAAGKPLRWSSNANRASGPNNGALTVTIIAPGSPAGAPYYFYRAAAGTSVGSTPGNPTGTAFSWVTNGNDTYTWTGLTTNTTYAVYVKDSQGCGLIGQVAYNTQVPYPNNASG